MLRQKGLAPVSVDPAFVAAQLRGCGWTCEDAARVQSEQDVTDLYSVSTTVWLAGKQVDICWSSVRHCVVMQSQTQRQLVQSLCNRIRRRKVERRVVMVRRQRLRQMVQVVLLARGVQVDLLALAVEVALAGVQTLTLTLSHRVNGRSCRAWALQRARTLSGPRSEELLKQIADDHKNLRDGAPRPGAWNWQRFHCNDWLRRSSCKYGDVDCPYKHDPAE